MPDVWPNSCLSRSQRDLKPYGAPFNISYHIAAVQQRDGGKTGKHGEKVKTIRRQTLPGQHFSLFCAEPQRRLSLFKHAFFLFLFFYLYPLFFPPSLSLP